MTTIARASRRLFAAILLFCLSAPLQTARAAEDARLPSREVLKDGGTPSWAVDCVLDLLTARERTRFAGAQPAPRDELSALDAEVDLLAAAMLALESPRGVLTLYKHWYGGNPRTPAAPLLQAQAHRMAAQQLFHPVPGRLTTAGVTDRAALFERANVHLVQGAQLLGGAARRGRLIAAKNRSATLVAWMRRGVPKPRALHEVNDPAARGKIEYVKLPPFQGVDYYRAYLEWEARLYRELGDLTFRSAGPAGAGTTNSGSGASATALAWYGAARDPLFTARLIQFESPSLWREAQALERRIDWIQRGRGFGGSDFYQFEPYTRSRYFTASLVKLDDVLAQLNRMQSSNARRVAAQQSWLGNLQQNNASRQALDRAYQLEARRQVQREILELQRFLAQQDQAKLQVALQATQEELNRFISAFGVELQGSQYAGELQRVRLQLLSDLLAMIQELERHGGLTDLKSGSDVQRVDRFIRGLGEGGPLSRLVREAWRKLLSPSSTRQRTTLDIVIEQARVADLERQRALDQLVLYDRTQEVERVRGELQSQQTQLASFLREVDGLSELEEGARLKKKEELDAQLQARILPYLQGEIERFAQRVQAARERIEQVQQQLGRIRKMIQDIKDFRKKVEMAYNTAVTVIETARMIPTTVAAGLATGITFNAGDAIAAKAQAVVDKLDAFCQGLVDAADLAATLTAAEERVRKELGRAANLETEMRKAKARLLKQTAKQVETKAFREIRKDFEQRARGLQKNARALEQQIREKEQELGGIEHFIKNAERRELANLANQAEGRARVAHARIEQALMERDHRLKRLRGQIERIHQRDTEASALTQLVDGYQKGLRQRADQVRDAKREVAKGDKSLQLLHARISQRVRSLQQQLRELDEPRKRTLTVDLLEAIAPAIALAANRKDPVEVEQKLLEARRLAERCARWLFLLGDARAAELATPGSSLRELQFVRDELQERWRKLRTRYAQTRHKLIVLRLRGAEIKRLAQKQLIVRTVSWWPPSPLQAKEHPQAVLDGPYAQADRAVWRYQSPRNVNGVATFYLTRTAAESAGAGVLVGGWLRCGWRKGDKIVDFDDPFLIPQLHRQGPIRLRQAGVVRSLPLLLSSNAGVNRLVQNDFGRAAGIRRFIEELPARTEDLLARPFAGQSHPHLYGLGLDNVWVFSVSKHHRDGRRLLHLQRDDHNLEYVDIVLAYLFPTRNAENAARPPRLDLTNLEKLPEPPSSPAPQASREARKKPASLTTQEWDAHLRDALNVQRPQLNGKATSKSPLLILQPIQLDGNLMEARALLTWMLKAVETDYVRPLEEAADTLGKLNRRTDGGLPQAQRLLDDLRRLNQKFDGIDAYSQRLRKLLEQLQSTQLSKAERDRLESWFTPEKQQVLRRAYFRHVVLQLRKEPAAQRSLVAFVLKKLKDELEAPPAADSEPQQEPNSK